MRISDSNLLRSKRSDYTPPVKIQFQNLLALNENLYVKKEGNKLYLSEDYGESYLNEIDVSIVGDIRSICIFSNKRLMLCSRKNAYYIDSEWSTILESTILDVNGNTWVPPLINDNMMSFQGITPEKVGNIELAVFGNYNNDQSANNDINAIAEVFYTKDYGKTIKVFFRSGVTTALNWSGVVYCRHIHHVARNPNDNSFWIQSGDEPTTTMSHWLKASYEVNSDTFSIEHIGSGDRYKTTNLFFYNEWLYYADDTANGGFCRVKISEASIPSKHEKLIALGVDLAGIVVGHSGQVALFPIKHFNASYDGRKITYSKDLINWHTVVGDMPDGGTSNSVYGRFYKPNSKGKALAGIQFDFNTRKYLVNFLPSVFVDEILEKNGFEKPFL